jgi:DNA-binding IclR family transcriptional regulator
MVKADKTLFSIIESLVEMDGATVTELAMELGMAKSTVHQHLTTLVDLEYAIKLDDEYNVGLRFLTVGEQARQKYNSADLVKNMTEQLAEETGERVQFFINEHGRAIYTYMSAGERGVTANRRAGEIRHIHSSSGGKAILSEMNDKRVRSIIDRHGLPAETRNTITNRENLFEELDKIREQGYSINKEESLEGLWGVGASVVVNGSIIGALSICAPRGRVKNGKSQQDLPEVLLSTTNELEVKLRYS